MLKQQLLNKKNIFLALSAIAVLVLYSVYEFGFLKNNQISENYNPNPKGTVAVIDSNIIVSSPVSNAVVASPLEITGRVKADKSFVMLIRNARDQVVASSTLAITSDQSDWAPYSKTLSFVNPLTPTGFLDVIPNDGSSTISIPLNFSAYQDLPIVNVFFSNIKKDPEVLNCDVVYPVQRRLLSEEVTVPAVLQTLFLGVSDAEVAEGYVNNLPEENVGLLSFSVEDGVASVDFNDGLQQGIAGSCRVMAIRAQITETLKQFDNIKEVVISVNGSVEEALQP